MTYLTTILGDNPFHYWEFPSGGGQLLEDFGSSPNVQVGGAANSGYAGVWDGGLAGAFNGATNYHTDATETLVAPCSVEAWCWIYSFNGADSILANWAGAGANGCGLHVNAARQPRFAVDNKDITTGVALTTQAWHHLVGVYSGGLASLYVDGALGISAGGGGALGAADAWTIGASITGANKWNGLLASVAVYHYALIAAQVAAHFAAAADRGVFPAWSGSPAGGFVSGPPIGAVDLSELSKILAAVQKTFPTT